MPSSLKPLFLSLKICLVETIPQRGAFLRGMFRFHELPEQTGPFIMAFPIAKLSYARSGIFFHFIDRVDEFESLYQYIFR